MLRTLNSLRAALPQRLGAARGIAVSASATQGQIRAADIQYSLKKEGSAKTPNDQLLFGKTFTDHMFVSEWDQDHGWHTPKIVPVEEFQKLHPGHQSIHYGMSCFEGMKGYLCGDGKARLFRPDMNMKRLARSSARLGLPEFDQAEMIECLKKLVITEKSWIPKEEGFSLYIRPFFAGTTPWLGIGPAQHATMAVICTPVGPYFPTGVVPVKLFVDEKNVRAWPGGVGDCKVAGNYAPTIVPQVAAKKEYDAAQVLYTFPDADVGGRTVSECGAMNMFFYLKNEQGEKELVTAPLDGTILPGVTRDSVLDMTRGWNEFKVSERPLTLDELWKAGKDGRILEIFGSGTACIIQPVNSLVRADRDTLEMPISDFKDKALIQNRLLDTLVARQYHKEPHPWSVDCE